VGSVEEFGPYVVYEQIGLGGMATVHRAETQGIAGFSKQVALKRMLPNVAADAKLVKSFIHEARLASNLRHANVAQTYDLGKVGETYFIAMELVPGRNLREILKHCATKKQAMPIAIALNIITQICDALDYAHNLNDESGKPLGIIHRDVSPANIIIGEGGIAKLIDFGIAKAASSAHTLAGTIKGKFSYMAPEYIDGFLDSRADLFAVGIIAHELLANRPLFQGRDDMDTLFRIKEMPILAPSQFNTAIPTEIDNVVMTALERDPNKRWQTAGALRIAMATEAQRLGLVAHNAEIEQWIDATFSRADTESPDISVSEGTVQLSKGSGQAAKPGWGRMPTNTTVDDDKPSMETETRQIKPTKSAQMAAQRPITPNVVPRNEFGDMAETRADSAAIDSLAASPLARRDVFDTPTVAGVSLADIIKAKESDDEDFPTLTGAQRATPPPPLIPPSGARTMPRMPQAIDTVIADLDERSSIGTSLPEAPRSTASQLVLPVLVLIAASGAAAVVYFALPYLS
jgi:serine/threonine protein kinase